MTPELLVVNGPAAGNRVPLSAGDVIIGRAPSSQLVLSDPEVGWRHCQIARRGDRYAMTDLRTSAGTFVNGTRSAERWLQDRDQIGIGKTILMFRAEAEVQEPAAPVGDETAERKQLLLAACSLVFLFRAVGASGGCGVKDILERQILRILSDLIPSEEGLLVLGSSADELRSCLRDEVAPLGELAIHFLPKLLIDGAAIFAEERCLGVPLYINGGLAGVLVVQVAANERANLAGHLETLTAVASLASIAFEANHEIATLKAENALLQEQIVGPSGIVGNSLPVRRLLELIEKVAPRETTVLITGESGTGKELIARALHAKSTRRDHPFIAVNCAALSENLFESELFGHEKGAFTGAIATKRGRFELANGGTIFLDEVGELALSLQPKLLRVLQEREFERVGGTQLLPIDVRVIAATNRDLSIDVREGKFREDLFHRINVVRLESPPLRERKDDILALARYFLQRSSERCKRQVNGLSPESEEILVQYSWPGNVRELQNAMERAVVLGVSDLVLPEDLPESLVEASPDAAGTRYHSSVGQAKKEAILDAYVQGNGDYKLAAKTLGLHPNYLLRLVRNLSLREEINRVLSMSNAAAAASGR